MSNGFFVYDVETIGIESTAVVLSAAFVYCDPDDLSEDNEEAYAQLLKQSVFVKFKAKEQAEAGRTITKSCLDWWERQVDIVKAKSFYPNKELDLSMYDGMTALRKWFTKYPDSKNMPVWARGGLDQMTTESICRLVDFEPFINYNSFRDVRTALDLIYDKSVGGYVEIPNFDQYQVIKHDPVHDCAYDALQLVRGKQ